MKRGLFVTFEGVEGVGKSTQANLLAQRISSELEVEVVLTREPGGTELAEQLRTLVLEHKTFNVSDRTEALLMAAARADHVANLIYPNLRNGTYVICDRFAGSFLAYQGYGRGLDLETLALITHFASDALEPDITFYLKSDPEYAMRRKGGKRDRIESQTLEFFSNVSTGYDELALAHDWVTLDASRSVEELHEAIFANTLVVMQSYGVK